MIVKSPNKPVSPLQEILLLETDHYSEDSKTGVITLEGVFQKGDSPNANRRVYPQEFLIREMARLTPLCENRALLGELDHPFYPDENEAAIVHLNNVSHVITKLWNEEATFFGRLECINTPAGIILQEFIKRNLQVGVSSRSLGSVTERANGFLYVDDNLKILTYDAVAGPSVIESKLRAVKALREWAQFQGTVIDERFPSKNRLSFQDRIDLEEIDLCEIRAYVKKAVREIL
jgi:hypothetical protein